MEEKQGHSGRTQNIILENRKRLSVSGVEEVMSFDEELVIMNTTLGELSVTGSGLHVENLSVDSGNILVTGEISAMYYSEMHERKSLRARLFG